MKIGLWNIDHPECLHDAGRRQRRYADVLQFLHDTHCDVYVLTEANAAIQLAGYEARFSEESPFRKKDRCYESPNRYHQVAVYSTYSISRTEDIAEPVNGLFCWIDRESRSLFLYGNVVTIKDRWMPESNKTYTDRLDEQLGQIGRLPRNQLIVCGDFNLRHGWSQRKKSYQRLEQVVREHGLEWPTKTTTDTVQHVIHSGDISTSVTVDSSVKERHLSDHPFVLVELENG